MSWNYEIKRRDQYKQNTRMDRLNTVGLPWTEKYYTINEIGSLYIVSGLWFELCWGCFRPFSKVSKRKNNSWFEWESK